MMHQQPPLADPVAAVPLPALLYTGSAQQGNDLT